MARRTKPRTSYHHGDLRAALLTAAVELLTERGVSGLSLRECARRAGVSHAAPYRHFADKDALLWAISRQGFGALTAAGKAAMADIDEPRARLDAYGVAYVRFAIENPVVFRVMFTTEFAQPAAAEPDDDGPPDHGAFELLVATAAAVGNSDDEQLAAAAAWSLPHGLAMLILDGRIPAEHADTPAKAEALARSVFAHWRRD